LKDTRDAYEEKVKEFTRQIKNLEESKEKQSKMIDDLSSELEDNEKKAKAAMDEIKGLQKKDIVDLNS